MKPNILLALFPASIHYFLGQRSELTCTPKSLSYSDLSVLPCLCCTCCEDFFYQHSLFYTSILNSICHLTIHLFNPGTRSLAIVQLTRSWGILNPILENNKKNTCNTNLLNLKKVQENTMFLLSFLL